MVCCNACGRSNHLIEFEVGFPGHEVRKWFECSECQEEIPLTDNLFEQLGAAYYSERVQLGPFGTVHIYSIDADGKPM